MAKKLDIRSDEDTLSKAIKLLDPEGILVTGAQDHDDTKAMVTEWFNAQDKAQVLERVVDCMNRMEGSK